MSLVVAAAILFVRGQWPNAEAAEVDLLERYPTTLTTGDAEPSRARPWEFTSSDIYRLTGFTFAVGTDFRVDTGPADLGIGHCADGAVWGIVIPRGSGTLTSTTTNQTESIAHVWLRFHPMVVRQLFPPAHLTGGDGLLVIDTRDPARPRLLDQSSEVDRGLGVALDGEMVYVLAGRDGLMILDRYQPPLHFEPGMALDATGFHLLFRGEANQTIRLQRSRDLMTWEDWLLIPGTGGSQEVVDPSASSLSGQFYRITPEAAVEPRFSILWYSSWNSWESINMVGFLGYSEVAGIAEELGAINEEVLEDTLLTPDKLSAYDAVVFMNVETARTLSADEQSALGDFLKAGKSILVIGQQDPDTPLSQEAVFANSVTLAYGIKFTSGVAPDATTLVDHPITQGLTSVSGGGSLLQVSPPAEALAPAGASLAALAVSSHGSGRIVAISDDVTLADISLEQSESGRRFASNVLKWLLHLESQSP